MAHFARLICSTLVLMCLATPVAAAQGTPPPAGPPPAQPKKVTGMVTAGLSLETGSTDLLATSLSATVSIRHSAKTTVSLDVAHMHVSTHVPGAVDRTTVGESQVAHLRFEYDASRRVVVIAQSTGTRDEVRHIERVEQFVGAGVVMADRTRARFRVIPIAAATVQNKNIELEETVQAGLGVIQDFTVQFNPTWSLTQSLLFRRYFGNDADYNLNASAALNGKVTSRLGVQVAYVHSHENLVMPGTIKWYQKVQAGLTYSF